MTWLALDTASPRLSVAAGTGAGDVVERHVDGPRQHASALLGLVEDVLADRGETLADLEALIVADGPGSFTGLRVGAAVAKGFHDARGLPVLTAPSLLGCAMVRREASRVLVTSDALRGEVYAAVYEFGSSAVQCLAGPIVIRREDAELLAPGSVAVHNEPVDARRLLALRQLDGGLEGVKDVAAWIPVYGRPAEAQARWEREHGRPLTHSSRLAG